MRRCELPPRADWRARVEAQGLVFHSSRITGEYWGEGTYYELSPAEADAIERATAELHARCLDAVAHVIEKRRYAELDLDPLAIALVEESWRAQPPSLYGRMDLAFGDGVPKLLEYNADTPTSLLEAAVIQWTWRADTLPQADQSTLLHERLIATWRALAPKLGGVVHFAHVDDLEDAMTVGYLRDTAEQAGLATRGIVVEDIGWDGKQLVDLDAAPITSLFKLYPWEGLLLDELAGELPRTQVTWLEPAWKMILSNKAILPILWELFPGHPNLLPASRQPLTGPHAKKPLFGREGANVTIVTDATPDGVSTTGPYDDRGYVYQAYAELGEHAGMRPVIGAWVVGDAPAGIGIRETAGYVTSNVARFVPHVIT